MHIPVWVVSEDAYKAEERSRFIDSPQDGELIDIPNWAAQFHAPMIEYWNSRNDTPRSYGTPRPLIAKLPGYPWEPPDFIMFGGFPLVSKRFRDALGDMPEAVEYVPVTLLDSSQAVLAQDYRFLNVTAVQPAFDLKRSYGKRNTVRIGGVTYRPKRLVKCYYLLPDFAPATEIFHERELSSILLATDSLAERVMRAGCTGVEFMDPATYHVLNGLTRFRTADGIGETFLGQ